jgi:glycosyltransferase involved in cell wall biosynthesis/ubiquinone/menaquinone biosynthesis C-methylase UbiE
MKLTVAVCTYRRHYWLARCLESLEAQTLAKDEFKVLVVDNSLQPGESERFRSTLNNNLDLEYIVTEKAGLSYARNVALERCRTPIIAYLDDDALAAPDWAVRLLAAFGRHNGAAGAVGGKALPIYEDARPAWLEGEVTLYLAVPDWGNDELVLRWGDPRWLVGANIAYNTQALRRAGGFPEHLGRKGELLLCHEEYWANEGVRRQGYSVVYDPQIVVEHLIQRERMTHRWICTSAFWESVSWVLCRAPRQNGGEPSQALYDRLSERLNGLLAMLNGAPTPESARQDALRFKAAAKEAMAELGYSGDSASAPASDRTIYIVTPCRNAAKTVDETILSVVSQAGDFYLRYHVQDGASTDDTAAHLEKWRKNIEEGETLTNCKGVAFSYSVEPDGGMYDAIAKGFGRLDIQPDSFMTWLNADDILFPGALSTITDIQTQFNQVDWVTGEVYCTRENGGLCQVFACGFPREFIRQGLCETRYWMFIQQEGTFWRKRLYDAVGGVRTSLRLAGDYELWTRFAQHADLWHFAGPLGSFHRRAGQLTEKMDPYFAETDAVVSPESKERAWKALVAQLAADPSQYSVPCLAYNWTTDSYYESFPSIRERTPPWKKGLYPENGAVPSGQVDAARTRSATQQPGVSKPQQPKAQSAPEPRAKKPPSQSLARIGRWSRQLARVLRHLRAMRQLRRSGLFADSYYLAQYPDVAARGMDPLFHYVFHGWREERDPNPLFSTSFYRSKYPDIAAAGVNPLVHYIRHGAAEERDPSPRFSTSGYLKMYPELRKSGRNPLRHYLDHGLLQEKPPGNGGGATEAPSAPALTLLNGERDSVSALLTKPATVEKANWLSPESFDDFAYAKRSHLPKLALFAEDLFGAAVDFDSADLKKYQDLLAYAFIRLNIPAGSRILEIGGGRCGVLRKLARGYECWNICKPGGANRDAPTAGPGSAWRQIKARIGDFTTELPDRYFDLVFSISTLEHIPPDQDTCEAVVRDINRVIKPGALSLHILDLAVTAAGPSMHPITPLLSAMPGLQHKAVTADQLKDPDDLYVMCKEAYDLYWRVECGNQPYEQFGRPTSINVLWRKAVDLDVAKAAVNQETDWLSPARFDDFAYLKRSHLSRLARLAEDLYGAPLDFDTASLKHYQDLLAYAFIRLNLPPGSRLLEVGGGDSRVLGRLAKEYECWDIDKLEGLGQGPLASSVGRRPYRQIRAYMGEFSPELPNQYFDLAFSISTLEHVPRDLKTQQALFDDIQRVLRPGALSLHLIDVVLRARPFFHPIIEFLFHAPGRLGRSVTPDDLEKADDIYFMSEGAYNNWWRKQNDDVPYEQFGRPSSVSVLWRRR